ncbi:MAG: hypothetical protein LAP61_06025 [Acidobacteriia bacterium]|nr:hypothetical protein [Terriglobia bacterium]
MIAKMTGAGISRLLSWSRRRQSGQELIEFGLLLTVLVPLLLGTFVTGISIVRGIQTNQMDRDLTDMYIHGADFSSYGMQQVAQRLARGLNLQIGSSFTNNVQSNTNNSGDVLVTVTQIMWIGSTTDGNCVAVGAANCTNHNKFVFTERIKFGNGTLATTNPSSFGDPASGAVITASGIVQSYVTDSRCALPSAAQTAMQNLWQVNTGGRTPLTDGRAVYAVETYVNPMNFNLGIYTSSGVYARYFF